MWLEHAISEPEVDAPTVLAPEVMPEVAQLDPSVVRMLAILEQLYQAQQQGRPSVSLAVICKHLHLRMSTVQRLMTALSEQQLVTVTPEPSRWMASLTVYGQQIAQALPTP